MTRADQSKIAPIRRQNPPELDTEHRRDPQIAVPAPLSNEPVEGASDDLRCAEPFPLRDLPEAVERLFPNEDGGAARGESLRGIREIRS